MWEEIIKKALILATAALFAGCGAKQAAPISADIPSGGYKKEMEEYEREQSMKKPTPSLWADVGSHGTIFLDYKARLIGDVVIVRIVESASANNSNNTSTGKTSDYNASITSILGLPTNLGIDNFLNTGRPFDPTIGASTSNSFSGQGSKARSDSISATIAARVVEILPSGNLLIEGQREIIVDQEKQTIAIKGMIRQKDIDANNTVPSTAIADAQIRYYGDGVISDANRKGWLATFIDWIWPF
ncbi:MAG: flagellar basal body L-ring protein FlgH [Deferribacteraceae bacterium]|jgi:flagellar L-ring protein precursor FlgH|nr:flagellar basal body L-ring protein FlgH [Deferribacteraceae bacterium]